MKGQLWWKQLSPSVALFESIEERLQAETSFVVQLPARLPWRDCFDALLQQRFAALRADRSFTIKTPEPGCEPGEYILDHFCPPSFRDGYWPGQTYAAYFASSEQLPLHENFIWLRGIADKRDLDEWMRFVKEYAISCAGLLQCAVFALEYTGELREGALPQALRYHIRSYDCQVFCLERSSNLPYPEHVQRYLAEVAAQIGGNDAELCDALLERHAELLDEPVEAASQICIAAGRPIPAETISRALWEAQITWAFPVVERWRMAFIRGNADRLARHLPIRNSNNEIIWEPDELEIGSLDFIVRSTSERWNSAEATRISLCRNVRNQLAHNHIVPFEQIEVLWD